jgi:TRAP-type uncharacterized transport system substrate-binding protein
MTTRQIAARFTTRGLVAGIFAVFTFALVAGSSATAWSAQTVIQWGTGPVGSAGYKALVVLANILNKDLPELNITVLPTPGAVTTVKGFALGTYNGDYASDVALKELKGNTGRFEGFQAHVTDPPIQSFWCYTLDVGLGIKASDRNTIKKWTDLSGKEVYTGPLPFDTRKYLEEAMAAVGVHHIYKQVDLETVGSQLQSGSIKGMIIYAAGGETPPPWMSEASLAVDWAALNPSPDELKTLQEKGFKTEEVSPAIFHKRHDYVKKVVLLPFFWGFDLGKVVSADEMYKILMVIDKHSNELAKLDTSFRQIGNGHMAQFEQRALESTWDLAPIHPGLEKYMKAKGVWNDKWDSNVAKF